jgi:Ca2+:H+ antiporter
MICPVPDTPRLDKPAGTVRAAAEQSAVFVRSDLVILLAGAVAIVAAGVTRYTAGGTVLAFACAAAAVALLASLVGRSVEQLGERFGAGGTGALQSALGNLPELFIAFFALRQGLVTLVQAAIIGSILANLLLVLGAAFVVGGLRHGSQPFDSASVRNTVILLALATSALVLPSLASYSHSPAERHLSALSVAVAIVLLVVFALSLPVSLRRTGTGDRAHPVDPPRWPVWLAVGLLAGSAVTAALVSDWFVHALEPAIHSLGISQVFAGLVIVAIAGNAVENVVGIQLAARNQSDYAMSVIINSPLQIALVLAPALVLLSLTTATTLTLVFAPLLVVAVALSVVLVAFIVFDGESNWLEGVILIGLYVIIAAVFWWG